VGTGVVEVDGVRRTAEHIVAATGTRRRRYDSRREHELAPPPRRGRRLVEPQNGRA